MANDEWTFLQVQTGRAPLWRLYDWPRCQECAVSRQGWRRREWILRRRGVVCGEGLLSHFDHAIYKIFNIMLICQTIHHHRSLLSTMRSLSVFFTITTGWASSREKCCLWWPGQIFQTYVASIYKRILCCFAPEICCKELRGLRSGLVTKTTWCGLFKLLLELQLIFVYLKENKVVLGEKVRSKMWK